MAKKKSGTTHQKSGATFGGHVERALLEKEIKREQDAAELQKLLKQQEARAAEARQQEAMRAILALREEREQTPQNSSARVKRKLPIRPAKDASEGHPLFPGKPR